MSKTCCDFGCNQGRDCPARIERIAQAARMTTASDHDADPQPDSRAMHTLRWLAISAVLALAAAAGIFA